MEEIVTDFRPGRIASSVAWWELVVSCNSQLRLYVVAKSVPWDNVSGSTLKEIISRYGGYRFSGALQLFRELLGGRSNKFQCVCFSKNLLYDFVFSGFEFSARGVMLRGHVHHQHV